MFHILGHQEKDVVKQPDTTACLLEWLNLKRWQHQMLMRMGGNKDFHSLLVEMESGKDILKESLAVSYKTNIFTILSRNHVARYWPKKVENMSTPKLHTQIFGAVWFIIDKT